MPFKGINYSHAAIRNYLFFIGVLAHFLYGSTCFAASGILEVYSEPSGAKVYIDEKYVGDTPYQNVDISTGLHRIKVFLNTDYPPQTWEVNIDAITPQVKTFHFKKGTGGVFTGKEMEQSVEKHKGNVQFASVPTGATVYINGEEKKPTPVGYRDVDVGHYTVEFRLKGETIKDNFEIVKDETVKIVAEFAKRKLRNLYKEERIAKFENEARIQKQRRAEQTRLEEQGRIEQARIEEQRRIELAKIEEERNKTEKIWESFYERVERKILEATAGRYCNSRGIPWKEVIYKNGPLKNVLESVRQGKKPESIVDYLHTGKCYNREAGLCERNVCSIYFAYYPEGNGKYILKVVAESYIDLGRYPPSSANSEIIASFKIQVPDAR